MLVQYYEPEKKTSLIEIPDLVREKTMLAETRAVVVALGPEAWSKEKHPRAIPGDRVLISKYSGFMAVGTRDGKPYRFINDRDIFAKIVNEGDSNG